MKTLAERLQYEMGVMGLSQEDLAKKVGTSQVSIQKILAGKTKKPREILAISRVLGCTISYLMTGDREVEENAPPVIPRLDWDSFTPDSRKFIDTVLLSLKNHLIGDDAILALQSVVDVMMLKNNNHISA